MMKRIDGCYTRMLRMALDSDAHEAALKVKSRSQVSHNHKEKNPNKENLKILTRP